MIILTIGKSAKVRGKKYAEKGHIVFNEDEIETDVTTLMDGYCSFTTKDGRRHTIAGNWDLILTSKKK